MDSKILRKQSFPGRMRALYYVVSYGSSSQGRHGGAKADGFGSLSDSDGFLF